MLLELNFVQNNFNSSQIISLIESGIKFFLFNRNQIQVPYESLTFKKEFFANSPPSPSAVESAESEEISKKNLQQNFNTIDGHEEDISPANRLKIIRERRQELKKYKIKIKNLQKVEKIETNIRLKLDPVFDALRTVLNVLLDGTDLIAVLLLFGHSIYNAKECIIFEIGDLINSSELTSDPNLILRKFYKSIILSSEFMDFTEKQLTRTLTNLLILAKNEMNSNNTSADSDQLIFREDYLKSMYSSSYKNFAKKTFKVKFSSITNNVDINFNNFSVDNNVNHLFDINSFCYQIPLRFKGIYYKNKL